MKTNKLTFLLVGVVLLSLVFSFDNVFAQVGTVGVSEGDWFKWSYSYIIVDEPTPAHFDIEWIKFLVTDISGTLVNGEATIKYNNGTEHTEAHSVDVYNDVNPIIREMLISTHYSKGDDINNSQHLDIDDIVTVTYLNEPREMFYSYFAAWSNVSGIDEEYYWDKQTGILVEMTIHQKISGDSGTSTVELKLIESNISEIPEFPSWIILPLFLIGTIAATVYKRKLTRSS